MNLQDTNFAKAHSRALAARLHEVMTSHFKEWWRRDGRMVFPRMKKSVEPRDEYLGMIANLLEEKADVNYKDKFSWTPLSRAVFYDQPDVVKLLLSPDHHADINTTSQYGRSLLHIASSPDVLSVLIEHKADVEQRDDRGVTPLYFHLSKKYRSDCLRVLLDAKADLWAQCLKSTGVQFAITRRKGDASLAHALVQAKQCPMTGSSALMVAIASGKTDWVHKLLGCYADKKVKDKYGTTPFMLANMMDADGESELMNAPLLLPSKPPKSPLL